MTSQVSSKPHSDLVERKSPVKKRRRRNNKGKSNSIVLTKNGLESDDRKETSRQNKKKLFADSAEASEPFIEHELDYDAYKESDQTIGEEHISEVGVPGEDFGTEAESKRNSISSNINPVFKKKGSKNSAHIIHFADDEINEEGDDQFYVQKHRNKHAVKARAQELMEIRKALPIYQHKDLISEYINNNPVVVIIGETGSGKSTQIPQFLMSDAKGQIAVTQPRRVAAASLAARVSEEYGCALGDEVGYQVRFANVASHKTKLKYLTDGMLLREIMMDDKLTKYSTIIIDEAHERTVLTDLVIGFLKELVTSKRKNDLKLIIMSATLNAELFSKFFDHAPILYVEGKTYPVTEYYLQDSSENVVDCMLRNIVQINMGEGEGDILCFLPGQEEIDNCVRSLNHIAPDLPKNAPLITPLPLYAALSPSEQSKIFEKLSKNKRKVILATNIAETSVTISGVKYVIDSGLRKVKVWRHQLGLSTLLTTPISRDSAKQRAGRAGRESPGKVYRLYTEDVYINKLPAKQEAEIMRNDIILPVLTLKKLKIDDILNWNWLEHPGEKSILSALTMLYSLGALDDNGKITSLGHDISILPLPPQLSVVLLAALDYNIIGPVLDIVSCLCVENLISNVTDSSADKRDEVAIKRRGFSPLGCSSGDLICLKEYYDHFNGISEHGYPGEAKKWCKDLFFNYRGFKTAQRIRSQLSRYILSMIKQDHRLTETERKVKLNKFKLQLESDNPSSDEDFVKEPFDIEAILKTFLKGYLANTAIGMPDRSFRTCNAGQLISIHPSSILFGRHNLDAIFYTEFVFTSKGFARNCSAIELKWLQDITPFSVGVSKASINV